MEQITKMDPKCVFGMKGENRIRHIGADRVKKNAAILLYCCHSRRLANLILFQN